MATRTIKQGEHLAGITEDEGFADFLTLWDKDENKELKGQRNPNVLFPGDKLFVPDLQHRTEDAETENRHRFIRKKSMLKLRLLVRNIDSTPVANADCELTLNGPPISLITDDEGRVEHEIPPGLERARLVVPDHGLDFDLRVGHLDPVDETSGVRARLNNLGYFSGYDKEEQKQLTWAVEEFQAENDIIPTGVVDDKTRAKLKEVHGV